MRSIKTPRTRTRTKNRLSIPLAQFVVAITAGEVQLCKHHDINRSLEGWKGPYIIS